MPLKPSERRLLVIGGVFAVGALLFNILSPPGAGKNTQNLLPTAKARQDAQVALRTLRRLNEEQEGMKPRIERLSYSMPPEQVVPRVVRDLQRMAAQAKLKLREVKPLRPVPLKSGQGVLVPLDVRFTAPFQPNVMQFLYQTESPGTRIVVNKLNISSADARRRSVDVQAQVCVYTRDTSAAPPAPAGVRGSTPARPEGASTNGTNPSESPGRNG